MASKSTRKKVAFNSEQRKMEENLENSSFRKKFIEIQKTRNLKIQRKQEIQKLKNPKI